MGLFGSQSADARKITVRQWIDGEGFICLEVSGVYYGRIKPGGNGPVFINNFHDEARQAEAIIGLVAVACGNKSEESIANLIGRSREWIAKNKEKIMEERR